MKLSRLPMALLAAWLFSASPALADTEGNNSAAPKAGMNDADRLMDAFQNDPLAPTIAPDGHDLTIVMFTDYQCGYCKMMYRNLQSLMAEDRKIRLVYRDWPIFGGGSELAARAAIASQFQGKYEAFNDALMRTSGKFGKEQIKEAAETAGVDWDQLQKDLVTHAGDISALLERNEMQATLLGFTGTPGLLLGPLPVGGAMDEDNLEKAVAEARKFTKRNGGHGAK